MIVKSRVRKVPRKYLELLLGHGRRTKKGDAFVFLVVIFSIFLVGMYYVVMAQAHDMVFTGINTSVGGLDARAENTNLMLGSVWQWLPVIMLLGFLVWAIVNSIRSKDNAYY